jgi:serine/threonine-protein kinase
MEQDLVGGKYRILEPLGEGGMAQVFKAEDVQGQRVVAIKILRFQDEEDPDALERFHQEARSLQALSHPNVVAILDQGHQDHLHYLVMEFVEGLTLQQLIREEGPISLSRALNLGIQIASAAGAAHEEAIIHRDLKPSNILVTYDDSVKVTDFGIAHSLSGAPVTDRGVVWGTASYLAPEQIRGRPTRFSVDVYAIGAVLYEMMTGCPPYQDGEDAADPHRILKRKLFEDPTPIRDLNPQIPEQMARIVSSSMAREPSQRYRTARQLEQILRGYRDRGASVTQVHETEEAASTTGSRLYWIVLATLAFFLLAAVPIGAFIFFRHRLDSPQPTATMAAVPPEASAENPGLEVAVPLLVGMGQEEARRTAAESGFKFYVLFEEYQEGVPPLTVITQTVSASELAQPGTPIGVVLSRGSEFSVVPRVQGVDLQDAAQSLDEAGFQVEVEERRSTQHQQGVVIEQTPVGEFVALKGSKVHLVVSSGPRIDLDVEFADQVVLTSCELKSDSFTTGDELELALFWEALRQVEQDYTVFVHLVYGEDFIAAQHDGQPSQGNMPTSSWKVGEEVRDSHTLTLPTGAAPGLYWIEVGLYHQPTMTRLKALESDVVETTPDGAVRIRQVEVELQGSSETED